MDTHTRVQEIKEMTISGFYRWRGCVCIGKITKGETRARVCMYIYIYRIYKRKPYIFAECLYTGAAIKMK